MHNLFRTSHGYGSLSSIFRKQPNALSLVSHLHNHSDDPALDDARRSTRLVPHPLEARKLIIKHPWPEWSGLMEHMFNMGYFSGHENLFRGSVGNKEPDQVREEVDVIRSACLRFSRDHSHLLKSLSRKAIGFIALYGCPSVAWKVVNSGKRLRAYAGIAEANSCRSCNLRTDCNRSYEKADGSNDVQTVDVMRILLMYGLDSIVRMVENKPCLNVVVKKSARVLLKEIVEYSSALPSDESNSTTFEKIKKMRDHSISQEEGPTNVRKEQEKWLCPQCNFLNFAKNLKCLRCDIFCKHMLTQLRESHKDHLPLMKGDWICHNCNFMNFARNTKCAICKVIPKNRKINSGEWECPLCNYINFRANGSCLKCEHRRPNKSKFPVTVGSRVEGYKADVSTQSYTLRPLENKSKELLDYPNSTDEASYFFDFPIAGGKGDLSRNKEKVLRWKLEMLESIKGNRTNDEEFKFSKNIEEFQPPSVPSRFEFSNLTTDNDGQDIAEWFVTTKVESPVEKMS